MKTLVAILCAVSAVSFASGAFAADKKEPTAQQMKMKTCNKEAGEQKLKGDERKKFMSGCLKGDSAAAAKTDNGCEAKAVSKEGKKLAGAAKNAFMKKCEADASAGAGAAAAK